MATYYLINSDTRKIEKVNIAPPSIVSAPVGVSALQLDELYAIRRVILENPLPEVPQSATQEEQEQAEIEALKSLEAAFAKMRGFEFVDHTEVSLLREEQLGQLAAQTKTDLETARSASGVFIESP